MPDLDRDDAAVTWYPPAAPAEAEAHFAAHLAFETDCWEVHEAVSRGAVDVVILDVRSPEAYAAGHVPGAINLPWRRVVPRNVVPFPDHTLFVVYSAGPHGNGADKAALRLAQLGRPVKKMIGGIEGWKAAGFEVDVLADDG